MQALYLEDCYLKEFNATVKEVNQGKYIVLDKTAFYPNSGGQPHDTGTLTTSDGTTYNIVFVGKFSGQISHEVDKEGLKVRDEVTAKIDWDRRYLFMRYHTASHVLSGVINKDTGAEITGNQIGEEKTRIDFSLENFDREEISRYEKESNEIIKKELPVTIKILPREEAIKIPAVFKLAKAFPDSIQTIRIIEIEGFDQQACGGTHLKNTGEIKGIKVIKTENKGKNNRRVYFELVD